MAKDLKYFMRPAAKEDQIVIVPGLESIKDENGKVIDFEIKKLSNEEIDSINKMYETKTLLKDKKGNFVINNGRAVYKVDRDNGRAARHIMAEALVYPNLKDEKLMQFFNCNDITLMPYKVFPDNKEFEYVSNKVMEVLNIIEPEDDKEELVKEAKN